MRKQRIQTARMSGQQLRAFGEGSLWPTKIRVDGAVGKRLARLGAGTEDGSVRPGRTPNLLCGACEPVGQHGGWRARTGTVECCLRARASDFRSFCPPRDGPRSTDGAVERGNRRGGRACAVCGDRYLQAGREGLHPDRRGGARETVTTWGSVTGQVLALRDHLLDQRVGCVVMEATGDYWKPFYYLLENASFELLLVNARHVKNLPGRKTDVCDAAW